MSSRPARPDARTVRRGLAVIGRAIRLEPVPFALSTGGAVLYAAMVVGSSVVVGRATDEVVVPALEAGRVTTPLLVTAAGAITVVGLLKAVGIVGRRVAASTMQYRLQARFRRAVSNRYLDLPLSWHRRHSTGELLSILNADVEAAFGSIAPLPFACGVVVLLLAAGGLLLATDPLLALIGVVLMPVLGFLNAGYNRRMAGPATRAQQYRATVSAVAHESVDGAVVVKTLGREEAETARFRTQARLLRDELVRLGRVRAGFDPLVEALPALATVVVLVVGALRVSAGALTLGDLVRVSLLFTLVAFPLRIIGYLLSELPRTVVGWDRIQSVLAARGGSGVMAGGSGVTAPVPENPGPARSLAERAPARLELRDVTLRHPGSDRDVLAGLTATVEPGTTVALVGATGSGKSTLAGLLLRLADPDRGAVLLDGVDLRDLAPGALPAAAALVGQQAFLFDDTVRGNVALTGGGSGGIEGAWSDADVEAACRLAQADGFVRELPDGYDTLVGERGASLSGGQRQRVALARALVRRPRLLVLDDATSAVDPSVEAAILAGLREAELAATVVVIAARSATIALADRVLVLDGGVIRSDGTHATLLDRDPAYAALVRAGASRPAGVGP